MTKSPTRTAKKATAHKKGPGRPTIAPMLIAAFDELPDESLTDLCQRIGINRQNVYRLAAKNPNVGIAYQTWERYRMGTRRKLVEDFIDGKIKEGNFNADRVKIALNYLRSYDPDARPKSISMDLPDGAAITGITLSIGSPK